MRGGEAPAVPEARAATGERARRGRRTPVACAPLCVPWPGIPCRPAGWGGMSSIPSKARRGLRDIASVLAAAAVALVTRSSLADHYVVPTGSMLPTVQLDDHVIVSKLAYGVHLPLLPGYVAHFGGPARGDVVVLTAPDTGIVLLKRVVAVPGDRVRVHDGALEVNGRQVPIEDRDGVPQEEARRAPARARPLRRRRPRPRPADLAARPLPRARRQPRQQPRRPLLRPRRPRRHPGSRGGRAHPGRAADLDWALRSSLSARLGRGERARAPTVRAPAEVAPATPRFVSKSPTVPAREPRRATPRLAPRRVCRGLCGGGRRGAPRIRGARRHVARPSSPRPST